VGPKKRNYLFEVIPFFIGPPGLDREKPPSEYEEKPPWMAAAGFERGLEC
jgi:hypothetical protein